MTATAPSHLSNLATSAAVRAIQAYATQNGAFRQLLESSLRQARERGATGLDRDLFDALDWPVDLAGYVHYLEEFLRWVPVQSNLPAWRGGNGSQEVYDRLCHSYFLIDQDTTGDGTTVQDDPVFSELLDVYSNAWGDFLNTPDSFSEEMWRSYLNYSPEFRVQDSLIDGRPNRPGGWTTFNQFFARALNPGLRPIASPGDNRVVTTPADCTYRNQFPIQADSSVQTVTLKQTHTFGTIPELLAGSPYADAFAGGTFVHYFLGPYSYHRFHTPVAGTVRDARAVHGLTYLEVNLKNWQFDAPDTSTGGYEFRQARGILVIDTANSPAGDVGLVAIVPVGMCEVSSVHMVEFGADQYVEKGTEFGHFEFGGSDIIVLFQEGVLPQGGINTCGDYRYYGTAMSECPDSAK